MKRITPMDIFNKDFRTTMRGYDTKEVDHFLDLVVQSYEEVLEENEQLKEQIRKLKRNGNQRNNHSGQDLSVYDDVLKEIMARLDRLEKVTFNSTKFT